MYDPAKQIPFGLIVVLGGGVLGRGQTASAAKDARHRRERSRPVTKNADWAATPGPDRPSEPPQQ